MRALARRRTTIVNKLQAIIFDVDGTLADTEDVHRLAFNHVFQEYGLDWYWSPELYRELLTMMPVAHRRHPASKPSKRV